VTLRPRDSRIAARDAAAMPFPREDTTPPVTKTNLVILGGRPGRGERAGDCPVGKPKYTGRVMGTCTDEGTLKAGQRR
jgi:hypothetical protein